MGKPVCLILLDVWNVWLFVACPPFFCLFRERCCLPDQGVGTWKLGGSSQRLCSVIFIGDHPKVKYFPMQPKRMMTRFSRIDNERSRSFGMLDIIVRFIEVNVAVFNKHVARGIRCFYLNGPGRVSKKQIFFLSIFQKKNVQPKKRNTPFADVKCLELTHDVVVYTSLRGI